MTSDPSPFLFRSIGFRSCLQHSISSEEAQDLSLRPRPSSASSSDATSSECPSSLSARQNKTDGNLDTIECHSSSWRLQCEAQTQTSPLSIIINNDNTGQFLLAQTDTHIYTHTHTRRAPTIFLSRGHVE